MASFRSGVLRDCSAFLNLKFTMSLKAKERCTSIWRTAYFCV